jgi:hypothetical protein
MMTFLEAQVQLKCVSHGTYTNIPHILLSDPMPTLTQHTPTYLLLVISIAKKIIFCKCHSYLAVENV